MNKFLNLENLRTALIAIKHSLSKKMEKKDLDEALASLVNSAPETLDTLGELAAAFQEHEEVAEALNEAIVNKMNKENPVGAGSFSMNRMAGSTIGSNSSTLGQNNIASGHHSLAEGLNTTAKGFGSHAEGSYTIAGNSYSHAEGSYTVAHGYSSHAEGSGEYNSLRVHIPAGSTTCTIVSRASAGGPLPVAIGDIVCYFDGYAFVTEMPDSSTIILSNVLSTTEINDTLIFTKTLSAGSGSHTEGYNSIALSNYSHVGGKNNIVDTNKNLAHILGNGSNHQNRSNAHTIDWNGNAWFAGDVYVSSTSGTNKDEGSVKLASTSDLRGTKLELEEYVNEKFAQSGIVRKEGSLVQYDCFKNRGFTAMSELEVKQKGIEPPYFEGQSKNKLNFPNVARSMSNGINMECINGVVILQGTATDNTYSNSKGIVDSPIVPYGSYKVVGGTEQVEVLAKLTVDGQTRYYYKGETFTVSETSKLELITCRIPSGTTIENAIAIYPMLVSADETDLTYTPYSNIRSFIGYDSVTLNQSGKNLFKYNRTPDVQNNCSVSAIDNGIKVESNAQGTYRYVRFYQNLPLVAGTTFTVSANSSISNSENFSAIRLAIYNKYGTPTENNKYLAVAGGGKITLTLTVTEADIVEGNCLTVVFYANTIEAEAGTCAEYTNIQLEMGNIATVYEPYCEKIYTISLGNTYYQGQINWNTREMTIKKKRVVFDGHENWGYNKVADGTYRKQLLDYTPNAIRPAHSGITPEILSSHYKTYKADNIWASNDGIGMSSASSSNDMIMIYDSRYNTKETTQWKAYLAEQYNAGTPVEVIYTLVEPEVIQLEACEPFLTLEGLNTLHDSEKSKMTIDFNRDLYKASAELQLASDEDIATLITELGLNKTN